MYVYAVYAYVGGLCDEVYLGSCVCVFFFPHETKKKQMIVHVFFCREEN